MADIALRNYLEEIDRMIDANQVDEAVAHAKYILGIYPKNLEAYKVLAKCLLEKNRHMDAADIFQRVLSAVPDDFVSHIGMSIAREDESNLDAAIWHMERAFEVQPSSGPVQEELKRLHGKREGMEPPKVRLTRGALARLYQKGHHYQQSIAELRAAIKEEPDRYDLKVLLAQALWHANRLQEATEVCNKILEILPFCREANRILALIWEGSGRETEAKLYRKRLEALDPYEAYSNLKENGSGAGKVPADNVHVPRLDYVPSAQTEAQDSSRPSWMQSVGVQFDQQQPSTDAPDWLSGLNIAGTPAEAAPIAEAPAPTTTPADDDWINTFTSGAPSAAVEEAAAPAQDTLPDWLGSSGVADSAPQAEVPAQDDWLNTLGATPEPQKQSGTGWLKEIEERKQREATAALTPTAETPAAESTPSWMDQPAASASSGEVPDWLKNVTEPQMSPGGTSNLPPVPTPTVTTDDVQGWLSSSATAPAEPQPSATGELPDWLKGSSPETPINAAGDEVPNWLKSMTGSPSEPAPQATVSSTGELPDWLKSSAAPQPQPTDEAPAWLKEEAALAPPQTTASQPPQQESGGEEIPDFMKQMGWTLRDPSKPLEEPNVFADEPIAETKPDEAAPAQIPDWLQSLKPQEEEAKFQASGDAPDWLRSALEGEAAPAVPTAQAAAPTPTPQETSAAPTSEDEALAWLESLAARQGAPADELVSTPQARKTVSTDWLRQPIAEEAPDKPSASTEETVPEWLRPPADEEPKAQAAPPTTPQPSASTVPTSEEDALAWLESLAARQGAPADELVSSAKGAAVETPDWLKDTTPEQPAPPVVEEKPEPSLADWLKQGKEEEPAVQPRDEIPDWLKEPTPAPGDTIVAFLKDKQTSSLPPKPITLEESARISKIGSPDWTKQLSEPGEEVPTPRISTIGTSPAWLNELSEEPSATQQTVPAQEPSLEDWLKEGREGEQPPATPSPSVSSTDEGDALAWLESLAARQGAKPDELVSAVQTRTTETPDWVKKSAAEEKPFTPAKSEPQDEKPAWLRQMEAESDYYEASRTAPTKPVPEIPEWLKPLEESAPPIPADDSLDWLKPPQKETKPATPPSTLTTPQGEEDALAWLESLAERQGAPADELVSSAKDRDLETPEWVKQSSIQEPSTPTLPSTEDKPDWLKQMEAESDMYEATLDKPAAKPEAPIDEEVPEWLRTLPPSTSPGDSIAAFLKDKPATSALRPLDEAPPQSAKPIARIETPPRPMPPPFVPEPPTAKPPLTPAKAEPPVPSPRKPRRAPKPKARRADQPAPEVVLGNARAHLTESNFGDAIAEYVELIRSGESLTEVIADLEKATQQNPNTPELMRTLGDAYMKDGQLQRSLDIYRQALKTL